MTATILLFSAGTFRVRGDVIEVIPAGYNEKAVRIEMFDDEVDRILEIDVLTGEVLAQRTPCGNFPGVALCNFARESGTRDGGHKG